MEILLAQLGMTEEEYTKLMGLVAGDEGLTMKFAAWKDVALGNRFRGSQ